MQSWDMNTTGRLERTSVPQEQGCEVSLNTEQMEPPLEEQQSQQGGGGGGGGGGVVVKGIPMPTD